MIDFPDKTNVSRIADWIELEVLTSGKPLSKNKIVSLANDDVEESKVDSAIQELIRRLNLYGRTKPYKIIGNTVTPLFKWSKYPEFTLCLIFSTMGAESAGIGTKLFERLTQSCIDQHFNVKSILFGFPTRMSFKDQVDVLAASCFENRGEDPTPFDKDRGVDIVGWKSFQDNRNSNVYLLVQCAAGSHWRDKKPVPLASWRRYISWHSSTTIPGIAIAQIVEIEKWNNAVDDYGVIIDRARLFRAFTTPTFTFQRKLRKEILSWCKKKLA